LKHNFSIGQSVSVLDENCDGIIVAIDIPYITIETSHGFIVRFRESEITPSISDDIKQRLIDVPNKIVIQKEGVPLKKNTRVKPKERNSAVIEVDLHIEKLVKSYKHMTNYEILTLQVNTAERQLLFAMSKRISKIIFIHGVGEGVLKEELYFLFNKYDGIKFYSANYQKYGAGATEVYIYQNAKRQ